jgi:hypothetical protein
VFDDLQTELGGPLLEQLHLLLAVSRLVVFQALIDVLVPPLQHAIDEASEVVSHRGDGFRCPEFAAEAAILGAEVAIAAITFTWISRKRSSKGFWLQKFGRDTGAVESA